MSKRQAFSVLELLVVLAILAVLIALTLGAIMAARAAAYRAWSINNLRQIMLATQSFASDHSGFLPELEGAYPESVSSQSGVFISILKYLDGGQAVLDHWESHPLDYIPQFRTFVSPTDPSYVGEQLQFPLASYAGNMYVFQGRPQLPGTIPDGTSNTIGFAEHYARCGDTSYLWPVSTNNGLQVRRASFADGGKLPNVHVYEDVYPVVLAGSPTVGSVPGFTFQVAPSLEECNPRIAQGSQRNVMLVAMMDGSVRPVSIGIAPTIYWSLVTPRGGESVSGGW